MEAQAAAPADRPADATRRRWYWCLTLLSIVGSLDVAQFLASGRSMFTAAPGRAAGSVLGLLFWLLLTGLAGRSATGRRSPAVAKGTVIVSGVVAVGSVGLVGIHAAAHVGGLRPAVGGVLGLAALGLALAASRS
ncbi:MAG TPA: hypothetical protein VNH82_02360 [Candidatus Dormibacteraeota bacterium]|nr:hypothetical protein [Candidatus Dormibacteraeota bacterium]